MKDRHVVERKMWVYGNARNKYGWALIVSVLLLAVSQALESLQGDAASFLRGLLVVLSIVSTLVGLYLYVRRPTQAQ
jgi:hypothetical protein